MSASDEPRCLRDLLDAIRRRPAMYLGAKSLVALGHVLYGYRLACRVHSTPERDERTLGVDADFGAWLASTKGIGEGSASPLLDLAERLGDAAAFDRFFELLDEYDRTSPGGRRAFDVGPPLPGERGQG